MQRSVELPTHNSETREEDETGIWRNQVCVNGLRDRPEKDIGTIFDLWHVCCERWSQLPCFGTRQILNTYTETPGLSVIGEEKKLRTYYDLGQYEYRSYIQVREESHAIGSGLRKLGLQKGDKVAIYAETS